MAAVVIAVAWTTVDAASYEALGYAERLPAFVVTVLLVDDVVALAAIALAYTDEISLLPLVAAAVLSAVVLAVRVARVRRGGVYVAVGVSACVALLESGVDPLMVGLVMGLLAYAYPRLPPQPAAGQ